MPKSEDLSRSVEINAMCVCVRACVFGEGGIWSVILTYLSMYGPTRFSSKETIFLKSKMYLRLRIDVGVSGPCTCQSTPTCTR